MLAGLLYTLGNSQVSLVDWTEAGSKVACSGDLLSRLWEMVGTGGVNLGGTARSLACVSGCG